MGTNEFHQRNIEWARSILAAPRYVMPNGRDSHAVAAEVLHESDDALLESGAIRVTAHGQRMSA